MKKSSRPIGDFAARLRAAREKRDLSQEELAKLTGLQASAVSHFETGGRKPSFDNLRRLAEALKVSTDYLLGRVTDMQALAGADAIHRHFDQLTAADQEMAEKLLKAMAERSKAPKERKE